jgi:lysophospholipase L1-like esterase
VKVLAVLTGLALPGLLLAGLEGAVRWRVSLIPERVVPSGREHPIHYNNPGVVTSPKAFGYPVRYRINGLGLRGPETAREKGSAKRVLILGDSVVFGVLVRDDETLAARLQSRLPGWEVLNGGVIGYDAWDYAAFLEQKGLALSPDVVVVGLFMNDHVTRSAYKKNMAQRSPPSRPLFARARDLVLRSALVQAANYRLQWLQSPKRPLFSVRKPLREEDGRAIDGYFPGDPGSARAIKEYLAAYRYEPNLLKDPLPWMLDTKAWQGLRGPLGEIKRACGRRGIKLMVAVFPTQYELYPGYRWPEPHRAIASLLAEMKIPSLDLLPVFAAGGADELYPMRYDYDHPDAKAYALAADAVAAKLSALGWTK